MPPLSPTGRTAQVASTEELQRLLQPFAGTMIEEFLDNPGRPTELRNVLCDAPERGDLDFDPTFRFLHLSVGEDPPDPTSFTLYTFDRNKLPTLTEVQGGKILLQQADSVTHLLLPRTPELESKLNEAGGGATGTTYPTTI